jgi:hypothetical protein
VQVHDLSKVGKEVGHVFFGRFVVDSGADDDPTLDGC